MSQTQPMAPPGQPMKPAQIVDERLRKTSFLTGAMRRPELGALAGLILVIIFFLFTANSSMFTLSGVMTILAPASQLGILAIAAALLMIGGEFDLSIGSMIAFTGLAFAAFLVNAHWPLPLAIVATLAFACVLGAINGPRHLDGLPSFIVTWRSLFILRGLTLVGLKFIRAVGGAGCQRGGSRRLVKACSRVSSGTLLVAAGQVSSKFDRPSKSTCRSRSSGLSVLRSWHLVLLNAGQQLDIRWEAANAARNSGVRSRVNWPFMLTACAAAPAILTVLDAGSTDASRG